METNKGPLPQEANKYLSMYDSEASNLQHLNNGKVGGPLTVGVKDLPTSDFESAHN